MEKTKNNTVKQRTPTAFPVTIGIFIIYRNESEKASPTLEISGVTTQNSQVP